MFMLNVLFNKYYVVFGLFTAKHNHGCPVTSIDEFVSNENVHSFSWLFDYLLNA